MTATIGRLAPRDKSAHVGRLATRFGLVTGRTPGSAQQRLTGNTRLLTDAVAFLGVCRELGFLTDGEAFLNECQNAFRGDRPEAWRPELVDEMAHLDGIEDARLLAIVQRIQAGTATEKDVREYARVLMQEITAKVRGYDAALALAHQLREKRA